ncbi:hypothetical protein JOC55_001994 [Paenibacillus sacheonensis]|nr:hypothetical protein [Paenibacillus sacheonensis]
MEWTEEGRDSNNYAEAGQGRGTRYGVQLLQAAAG